jgi:hypothetical protein
MSLPTVLGSPHLSLDLTRTRCVKRRAEMLQVVNSRADGISAAVRSVIGSGSLLTVGCISSGCGASGQTGDCDVRVRLALIRGVCAFLGMDRLTAQSQFDSEYFRKHVVPPLAHTISA